MSGAIGRSLDYYDLAQITLRSGMSEYQINYNSDRCVEVRKDFFGFKVCRIPYPLMKSKSYSVQIEIKHVVYILSGKDAKGKDCLYVGKSSNGTKNRPTDHENEGVDWTDCYILTVTDSNSFNGGMAEYLEHRIKEMVDDSDRYRDITKTTSEVNANDSEKRRCDAIIPTIIEMLDTVGICLLDQTSPVPSAPLPAAHVASHSEDISSLGMGRTINGWLERIEQTVKTIDPSATTIVKWIRNTSHSRKARRRSYAATPRRKSRALTCSSWGLPTIMPMPESPSGRRTVTTSLWIRCS